MLQSKHKNNTVSKYYIISSMQLVIGGVFSLIFLFTTIISIMNLGLRVKSNAVIVSFILFVIFFLLFIFGMLKQVLVNQYFNYIEVLNQRKSYSIDELATVLNALPKDVRKNLEKMSRECFFEYIYLDNNTNRVINTMFQEDSQIYANEVLDAAALEPEIEEYKTEEYETKEADVMKPVVTSDRVIQIVCKNCGAPNKVASNAVAECMYCGSIIN